MKLVSYRTTSTAAGVALIALLTGCASGGEPAPTVTVTVPAATEQIASTETSTPTPSATSTLSGPATTPSSAEVLDGVKEHFPELAFSRDGENVKEDFAPSGRQATGIYPDVAEAYRDAENTVRVKLDYDTDLPNPGVDAVMRGRDFCSEVNRVFSLSGDPVLNVIIYSVAAVPVATDHADHTGHLGQCTDVYPELVDAGIAPPAS